jgi:hypothetical protein
MFTKRKGVGEPIGYNVKSGGQRRSFAQVDRSMFADVSSLVTQAGKIISLLLEQATLEFAATSALPPIGLGAPPHHRRRFCFLFIIHTHIYTLLSSPLESY